MYHPGNAAEQAERIFGTPDEANLLDQLARTITSYNAAAKADARYLTCHPSYPWPPAMRVDKILGLVVVLDGRCPPNQLVLTHAPILPEDVFPECECVPGQFVMESE